MPQTERTQFIEREANGDTKLVATVMSLLASATQASAPEHGESDPRVQSTATRELLARLTTSPKLDINRYTLEGEVGRGGMGAVIRIHAQQLNRRLAMKVPPCGRCLAVHVAHRAAVEPVPVAGLVQRRSEQPRARSSVASTRGMVSAGRSGGTISRGAMPSRPCDRTAGGTTGVNGDQGRRALDDGGLRRAPAFRRNP